MNPANRNAPSASGRPVSWAMSAGGGLASSSSGSSSICSAASGAPSSNSAFLQQLRGAERGVAALDRSQVNSTGSSSLTSSTGAGGGSSASPRRVSGERQLASFGSTGSTGSSSANLPPQAEQLLQQSNQINEENEERLQEENRKLRLQLYVFVLRCISYTFNAKPMNTSDLHQKQQQIKLRSQQLEQIIQLHTKFIKSGPSSFNSKQCPHQHLINKSLTQQQLRKLDDVYERVHITFNRRFLQNERMKILVESECCSQQDLRDLFKQNADKILKQSGLFSAPPQAKMGSSSQQQSAAIGDYSESNLQANKELVLNSWLIKFESIIRASPEGGLELGAGSVSQAGSDQLQTTNQQQAMSKEQLYQMFQNVLNIKKFEHQLLYNALQLDSSDEQAAAVRRELDGRIARIAELERNKKLLPKFVLKEMESLYLEEARMSVNKLMVNLDSLPLLKGAGGVSSTGSGESRSGSGGGGVGYGLQKFRRYNNRAQASLTREGLVESHPSEPSLTKLDVVLTFNIEVIVMEVRGLRHLAPTREIYCTMEIEGSERLQTEHVQAKKPLWDTQGDFTTNHPLPVLKIKLYAVNQSMLSLEDKELGKLVLRPTVLSPKTPEWCTMQATSSSLQNSSNTSSGANQSGGISSGGSGSGDQNQELKIRVVVRMDRPQQLKHCGYLYGVGKSTWRKLKRRYHILIQVSQYTFVMCSYRDKKSKPTEMLQLEGYTVDYIEPPTDLIMEHCSEMTAQELHGTSNSNSSSTPLGLAGRLANVILKQPVGGGTSGGGGSGAQEGAGSSSPGIFGNSDRRNSSDCNPEGGNASGESSEPSAIATAAALSDELHSKFYFNVVKEGDSVVFACDDEQECFGWVMALYRATGQAHKPTPLRNQYSGSSSHYIDAAFAYQTSASQPTKLAGNSSVSNSSGVALGNGPGGSGGSKLSANKSVVDVADQRARKHGMDEFISSDPCKFQHNQLFKYLQNETLKYRLNDQFCSLGWFSAGQILVLDEYCARYAVRTCFRHLSYLNSLLDFNQRGYFIDHTLLNYGYDFCASHVSGNSNQAHPISSVSFDLRPDGVGTVTMEERDLFNIIKAKLLKMIERQISNFSYCFPFGKPDGALKTTLSLLERVLMKEQQSCSSMVGNEEVRQLIRKCLEQAALNNYTKLSGQANLLSEPEPVLEQQQQQSSAPTSGAESTSGSGRARTPSNLSSSSIGSYASVTNAANSTTTSGPSSADSTSGGGGGSSFGFSFRRSGRGQSSGEFASSSSNSATPAPMASPVSSVPNQTIPNNQANKCLTMAMIINNDNIKPKDKLRYLTRLAELCCEQVEESQEYFSDAFAWHSDLMLEHYELFWSLFSVDMDKILAEQASASDLSRQPAVGAGNTSGQQPALASVGPSSLGSSLSGGGRSMMVAAANQQLLLTGSGPASSNLEQIATCSRDIFALFQVLNNHMKRSLECKRFKSHLCDTFKPRLLRHIDLMESSLTRTLFKACERDSQINCQLIELIYNKLDELQRFVLYQLRWPDQQMADQLHQRLKLIAFELCEAVCQKSLQAFQANERKLNKWTSSTTSYAVPLEMIQMINLVLDTRSRSLRLCTFNNFDQMSYHARIDKLVESVLGEMQPGLMAKMVNALESTLTKLARHDEGNLLAPILSLTYKQGMSSSGKDIGRQYVTFVSNCCDLIRNKINDELWIVNLFEEWYAIQMNTICNWLSERLDHSLHDVQLVALTNIMPKVYADMSLQGVPEEKLNLKSYQTVMSRLKMEEASAMAGGALLEQPASGASIFTSSILSSLTSSNSNSAASSGANSASQPAPPSTNNNNPPTQMMMMMNQQQTLSSPTSSLGSPTPAPSNSAGSQRRLPVAGQAPQAEEPEDNIADRALQSATRMFKGFWAN